MSYETLRLAIRKKSQVSATYTGKTRRLCPHVLGTKEGVAHVLAYQVTYPKGWKCMVVSKLSNVSLCAGAWETGTHGGYQRDQKCVDYVEASV